MLSYAASLAFYFQVVDTRLRKGDEAVPNASVNTSIFLRVEITIQNTVQFQNDTNGQPNSPTLPSQVWAMKS